MINKRNYEYNKNFDTFCFQNCINYILNTNRVENAEFYINKSMSTIIKKDSKEDMINSFDRNCHSVVPEYSQNVKSYWEKDEANEVFRHNVEAILNDRQIIVSVDSYYLPYLPFYRNSHGLHGVIIKEYNEKKRKVRVIDPVEPWYFDNYVGLDEFLEARNSLNEEDGGMFCGIPVNNRWKEVLLKGWDADLDSLIKSQIKLTLKQYYYPGNYDDEIVKGIDALVYVYEYLQKIDELSEENQGKLLTGIHKVLYRLNHRRKFWCDFLDKIPIKNDMDIFREYVEESHAFEKSWEMMLFKVLMIKAKRRQRYVSDICEKMNQLIVSERKSGEKLVKYLECYNK